LQKTTRVFLVGGVLSGIVKLFFILALFFSNVMCFATEQEELSRLKEISAIVVKELELDWSPSKLTHDTYIGIAKERNAPFGIKEANDALPYISARVAKKVDMSKCFKQSIVDNYIDAFKKNSDDVQPLAEILVLPILETLQRQEKTRVVTCGLSAFYTFDAVVFDMMNQQVANKKRKSIFVSAVLMSTKGKTGDHLTVMVGGSSGAVYLVDTWLNKVVSIQGFSGKSGWNREAIQSSLDITLRSPLPLKGDLNTIINAEFKETYNGVDYYDMVYVGPSTEWELLVPFSKHMRWLLQTSNNSIKPLYDNMRPAFGWGLYDDLFDSGSKAGLPGKPTETKVKVGE
jgi:hypothetical protein